MLCYKLHVLSSTQTQTDVNNLSTCAACVQEMAKDFGDYLGSCSFCWGAFGFLPASQGVANEPAQVQPAALVMRLCVESIPDQLILLLQDMAR